MTETPAPKKRFIVTSLGGKGDFVPMISAAEALKKAGHDVVFLANAFFEKDVAATGLKFVPVGTAQEFIDYMKDPRLWIPREDEKCTHELIVRSFHQYKDAMQKAKEQFGDYDAVVNCPLAIGAAVVAESEKKPHFMVTNSPFYLWFSSGDVPVINPLTSKLKSGFWAAGAIVKKVPVLGRIFPPVLKGILKFGLGFESRRMSKVHNPDLNDFRKELGLSPVQDFYNDAWTKATGIAGFWDKWFGNNANKYGKDVEIFGAAAAPSQEVEMTAELKEFMAKGSKPLLWTFGSINTQTQADVERAVEVSRMLRKRAVIVTQAEGVLSKELAGKDVIAVKLAPFSRLMHQCEAVIHHGGTGTMTTAIHKGVPQMMMPKAHDAHDAAWRAKKAGVAEVVPATADIGEVAERLQTMLGDKNRRTMIGNYQDVLAQSLQTDHQKAFARWIERKMGLERS